MSQTLQHRHTENRQHVVSEPPGNGFGWRKLLGAAALGSAAALAVVSVAVFKAVVPPLAVMFVLLAAGGVLALRRGKAGVTGVVLASAGAMMFAAIGTGFVMGVIGAPEEPREFIPIVTGYALALVVVVSAVVVGVRGRGRGFEPSSSARIVGGAAVLALIVVTGWSLVARMNFESAPASAGDLRIGAREFAFDPAEATAAAGDIAVHVTNRGAGLHTFTIDSLGVDMAIPAGKSQRVAFQAAAGDYTFHCKLHPGMEGSLTVTK
jgi:plastocyanin